MTSRNSFGVSFFLPFYNEEAILEENATILANVLKKQKIPFEIVLVDDTSKDGSPAIGKRLGKKKPFRYVRYETGPSRRENLAEAFKSAKFDYVAFMDIDLATDIRHIDQLLHELRGGAHIVIGSRYKGIKAQREMYRLLLSTVYNHLIILLFGSRVKDHQCGFKAFRKNELIALIEDAGYDRAFQRGWFWDAEILIRAQKKKLRIVEFPVKWKSGKQSSFNFKREFKILRYMFGLKRRF